MGDAPTDKDVDATPTDPEGAAATDGPTPEADDRSGGPRAEATSDTDSSGGASSRTADGFDLRGIVKQFTAPMIESLDSRLREQVEAHADSVLDQKIDAALADRLATIERAIADLSRSIASLERRVEGLERSGVPPELDE